MNGVTRTRAAPTGPVIETFRKRPLPLELHCGIQHYDWGSFEAIPRLLHRRPTEHRPYAELWMGAHPDLPAKVVIGNRVIALNDLIGQVPDTVLGVEVTRRFGGRLPFLFKLLSARKPLSIQAHPNRRLAAEGFARENALNIAITDRNRNYKDDNHKPEMIAALTDFYALCGFRPLHDIARMLRGIPEFEPVAAGFEPTQAGLQRLYQRLLSLPQHRVNALLTPFLARLDSEHAHQPFTRETMEYWLLVADRAFSRQVDKDRGLFSVCLLNLVHLRPGQAMFLKAGVLHGYLEGTGLEVMANSNNVLRGGLTRKHVDATELLRVMDWSSRAPALVPLTEEPLQPAAAVYRTPAEEFELVRLQPGRSHRFRSEADHGPHIAIVIEGEAIVSTEGGKQRTFASGQVFLIPSVLEYSIAAEPGALLYLARVPLPIPTTRSGAGSAPTSPDSSL